MAARRRAVGRRGHDPHYTSTSASVPTSWYRPCRTPSSLSALELAMDSRRWSLMCGDQAPHTELGRALPVWRSLLVLAAVLIGGCEPAATGPSGTPRPAATVIAETLTAPEAYDRGVALQRNGEHVASVPYFRRAVELEPGLRQPHDDLALALHDAAIQTELADARVRLVVPSSDRRVAMLREALEELDRAERLAPSPAEHALVHGTRGRMYQLWGFPNEALEEFDRAVACAPQWTSMREYARDYREEVGRGGGDASRRGSRR